METRHPNKKVIQACMLAAEGLDQREIAIKLGNKSQSLVSSLLEQGRKEGWITKAKPEFIVAKMPYGSDQLASFRSEIDSHDDLLTLLNSWTPPTAQSYRLMYWGTVNLWLTVLLNY